MNAPYVLGISGLYHDSAAALVHGGHVIAAAHEERFSRHKHDAGFPAEAINYCLEEAFIEADDLAAVVFYDSPLLTLDRVVRSSAVLGEAGASRFDEAARALLGSKIWIEDAVRRELGSLGAEGRLLITDHHAAHAASAFYPSPFEEAAVLTIDGVGEWETTTIGVGSGRTLELIESIRYPHSLGLLYSAFTSYCGFRVNSGEYKLMGLAPYGTPRYRRLIEDSLIDLRPDGSFRLDTRYFGYLAGSTMTNAAFHDLFGGAPRVPETAITQRDADLAASIQAVAEEALIRMARHTRQLTGRRHLTLAGGVALNCVANGLLHRARIFDRIWVQPAAGDAGGALGAALLVAHDRLGSPRPGENCGRDRQRGSLLGPAFTSAEVRAFLDLHDYPYRQLPLAELNSEVAQALAGGSVVGRLRGRMEFGPRSLGARSILGNPCRVDTQVVMNTKIKFRESFRPFAPAILAEDCHRYFELDVESPYMLLVADVLAERRRAVPPAGGDQDLYAMAARPRSDVPAVTHVDFSARVQTVSRADDPDFHDLIAKFGELTGHPVVVNTSFNVRGEPPVCTPEDAYGCFMRTDIDLLVLEDCLLRKDQQPEWTEEVPDVALD
ncbi:carbamoyltransferase N-terminal domain-containing protein [Micropruina sp.]|uniref:carbamoyltransferase family protein n=1 Tax=Micropruina sp. TaxID=2737536 RepID=UPI002628A535|nr:carbamoyltransferase N-terminal domain-containing protein [Micropruina sp.]